MTNQTIPVVWTNDDIEFGRAGELRRELQFLDGHEIPGVFFVIPASAGGSIDQDKDLLSLIEKARERGHEFYQHGFMHTAYECGIPEIGMLKYSITEKNRFDEQRELLERQHTFEAQIEMIESGRRIWRRAFGEDSMGFRPGWGAYCGNHYKALAALGFEWVSSRIPCMTSWDWNRGAWDAPIHFRDAIPTAPHAYPEGVVEFPMAGDYSFRVPNHPERINAMIELGMREFDIFFERRDPMLIVSHYHGLEFSGTPGQEPAHPRGTGYAVHEKLIPALINGGRAAFMGMEELTASYQNLRRPGRGW